MHRNFEAMNIGKEPPDDNGKAPRPMKTYAAGALAAAAVLALFSLVAGSESIASLGGDAQEKWNDVPCPAGVEVPKVDANSRVLVTGGAGFIGMSLMASLGKRDAKTKPAVVIGIDSFNDYYAPAMKRGRAQRLKTEFGYDVIEADVCDTAVIDKLFEQHRFTHVVHLAAQAGVRYSITHPMTYVHNNYECVVSLLDYVAHKKPQPAYVYASSSASTASTRRSHSASCMPSTIQRIYMVHLSSGTSRSPRPTTTSTASSPWLRFFTVYGPWGRPDMAVSLFTNKIENGETITLFNGGEMWRDFTFVDDIVQGIELSMEYCSDNAAVFNLGNSKPVKLGYFLEQIEKRLGVKAKFKYQASNAEIKAPTPTCPGKAPERALATSRRRRSSRASTSSWPGTRSSTSGRATSGPGSASRRGRAPPPALFLLPCANPTMSHQQLQRRRVDGVPVTGTLAGLKIFTRQRPTATSRSCSSLKHTVQLRPEHVLPVARVELDAAARELHPSAGRWSSGPSQATLGTAPEAAPPSSSWAQIGDVSGTCSSVTHLHWPS